MSSRSPFDLILAELRHAKLKHPRFAVTLDQALVVLSSEQGELASAILKNDIHGEHGVIREAAQVAAVAIRIIELAQENRTCESCANDGPGYICQAGHDNEGGCSNCRDWQPRKEASA